jgi:hypothetical protein
MKRRFAVAALLLGGCTTNPAADFHDHVFPAKGVCVRANAPPTGVAGGQPGCPAALNEDQNYRKGVLERFRRSNHQGSGVPPAAQTPAAKP